MRPLDTRGGLARAAALAAVAGALALVPAASAADAPLYGVGTNSNTATASNTATVSPTIVVDVRNLIVIDRARRGLGQSVSRPPAKYATLSARKKAAAKARAAHRKKRHVAVHAKARSAARPRRG
jgi:hypothetical protein